MISPWRHLREHHSDWTVVWQTLPDSILGLTDYDRREIVLDKRQLQAQRRCTLWHELTHVHRGDTQHCNLAVEAAIERQVARDLISIEDLRRAQSWAASVWELAEELWVDEALVMTRLASLHPSERRVLRQISA